MFVSQKITLSREVYIFTSPDMFRIQSEIQKCTLSTVYQLFLNFLSTISRLRISFWQMSSTCCHRSTVWGSLRPGQAPKPLRWRKMMTGVPRASRPPLFTTSPLSEGRRCLTHMWTQFVTPFSKADLSMHWAKARAEKLTGVPSLSKLFELTKGRCFWILT